MGRFLWHVMTIFCQHFFKNDIPFLLLESKQTILDNNINSAIDAKWLPKPSFILKLERWKQVNHNHFEEYKVEWHLVINLSWAEKRRRQVTTMAKKYMIMMELVKNDGIVMRSKWKEWKQKLHWSCHSNSPINKDSEQECLMVDILRNIEQFNYDIITGWLFSFVLWKVCVVWKCDTIHAWPTSPVTMSYYAITFVNTHYTW